GHGADTARLQPGCHPLEIGCPRSEFADRVGIAVRGNGDKMTGAANVDAGGIGVHQLQFWSGTFQPSGEFPPLAAVQRIQLQTLKSGFRPLGHVILSLLLNSPGSAQLAKLHKLSGGVEPAFFKAALATKQSIAATEVTLRDGHRAPRRYRP